MTIEEVLQSLRDCDYAECKEWADAIEEAMREKDAEIERLERMLDFWRDKVKGIYLKESKYSDLISDGGMDPRDRP